MEENKKQMDEKYCGECGKIIKIKAEICPHCGCRQLQPVNLGRNKLIAAMLALFLGGFGAHKFYLGKIGIGFLYLIFCWTIIPVIIAFVEGLLLLAMSEHDFRMKYGE